MNYAGRRAAGSKGNLNGRRKGTRGNSHDEDYYLGKLTPEEWAAIERKRDVRERDEFAKRLNEKDKRRQGRSQRSRSDGEGSESDGDVSNIDDRKDAEVQKRMERLRGDCQGNRGGWRRPSASASLSSEEEADAVINNRKLLEQRERNRDELRRTTRGGKRRQSQWPRE